MAVEIISIPYVQLEKSGWFLKSFEINLDIEPYMVTINNYPIAQTEILPIGTELSNGIISERKNGVEKNYEFKEFQNGTVQPLSSLDEPIYSIKDPTQISKETMVYVVPFEGRNVVFFTYELFRQFIANDVQLCKYIMEHEMLSIMIDKEMISNSTLTLELNNLMNVGLLRNDAFIFNLIKLLYHKETNRYWREIRSNSINGKNNFSFNKPPYNQLNCSAQIIKYKEFDLVLHIKSIESDESRLPFDKIELIHTKLKSKSKKSNNQSPKNKKFSEQIASKIDFEDQTSSPSPSKQSQVPINKHGIKHPIGLKIERLMSNKDAKDNIEASSRIFKEFKLRDLELSFRQAEYEGTATTAKLIDTQVGESFDFTIIPSGLQRFCSAISIVSKTLNAKFNYNLIDFPNDLKSPFLSLKTSKRKCVLITFQGKPNIQFIEVDNSDGKFISTLVFKDLKIFQNEFLYDLLTTLTKRHGKWDMDYLETVCFAETIRHPRKSKKYKKLSEEDFNDIYTKRIAIKLITILQS